MTWTLGIDIGTFESKGALVDPEGRLVAQAAVPHRMLVPQPGWAEHCPEADWWGDFCTISNRLIAESGVDPRAIAGVACSAIGPCMLPVDAEGRPLMNGVLYGVDTRALTQIAALTAKIGADTLMARCGNALTSQSVGPKILWVKETRPEIWERAAKFVTSTSFLLHRLTGEWGIDHYTAANFSPLYDVTTLDWADDLCEGIVERERLPRLYWSSEIVGGVTARAAAETGLAEGTPVTCGTVDAAAEAISVGLRHPGDMMMMYGSTIFIIMNVERRIDDPRLWYAPWLFPGEHASMAGLTTSGTLTHWFRDQFARELTRDEAFPVLAAEAEASPAGANGLLFLPYFSGERTPIHDIHAKGAWFGLNLTHTRGDMFRALIEGIGQGTRHVIETYREDGAAPRRMLAVGGGTKNALWLQATSDMTGVDQEVREKTLGASYGDAFLARLALGEVTRADIDRWNRPARVVTAQHVPAYDKGWRLFRRLYEQTKDIARELS